MSEPKQDNEAAGGGSALTAGLGIKGGDRLRWFGLETEGSPTTVQIAELSDGGFDVALITKREGMPDIATSFRLMPLTFSLLTEALARAAHDPLIWRKIDA